MEDGGAPKKKVCSHETEYIHSFLESYYLAFTPRTQPKKKGGDCRPLKEQTRKRKHLSEMSQPVYRNGMLRG